MASVIAELSMANEVQQNIWFFLIKEQQIPQICVSPPGSHPSPTQLQVPLNRLHPPTPPSCYKICKPNSPPSLPLPLPLPLIFIWVSNIIAFS